MPHSRDIRHGNGNRGYCIAPPIARTMRGPGRRRWNEVSATARTACASSFHSRARRPCGWSSAPSPARARPRRRRRGCVQQHVSAERIRNWNRDDITITRSCVRCRIHAARCTQSWKTKEFRESKSWFKPGSNWRPPVKTRLHACKTGMITTTPLNPVSKGKLCIQKVRS